MRISGGSGVVELRGMDEPRHVLTYATPRSVRRFRKPLRTRIVRDERLPYVSYTEESNDKAQAPAAVAFALVTLLIVGAVTWHEWHRVVTMGLGRGRPVQAAFLTLFCLIEAGAIAAVVQQVWKRTILSVRDGELWLEVVAPVASSSRRWRADQILGVDVWTTDDGDMLHEPLAELHVRPQGVMTMKLFRNYPRSQLLPVAGAIEAGLAYELAASAPAAASDGSTQMASPGSCIC